MAPLVIALSFISGSLIALDSSQVAVVKAELKEVPVDFIGRGTDTDVLDSDVHLDYRLEYMSSVDAIEDVEAAVVLTYVPVESEFGIVSPFYPGGYYPVIFMPHDNERTLEAFRIVGEMPAPGTIALPKQMADDIAVTVGDTVTLRFRASENIYDPYHEIDYWIHEELDASFTVSEIWTQDGLKEQEVHDPDGGFSYYLDVDERAVLVREYMNPAVLNLDDLYPIVAEFGYDLLREKYYDGSETLCFIWIDRDQYIDYMDT